MLATPGPSLVSAISIGCSLSLPSMLAVWSSVRLGMWRYAMAVVLSALNGFFVTWVVGSGFRPMLFMLPLASTLPVFLTLLIIKRGFGHFALLKIDAEQFLEGLRFNLSHLFIVTTLLAVLVPVGKLLWPMLADGHQPADLIFFAFLIALISGNTLIFVWALLGKHAILRTCIVIPIGIVSLVVFMKFCVQGEDLIVFYTLTGLPLLSTFVLMATLRFSGWRFIRGVA